MFENSHYKTEVEYSAGTPILKWIIIQVHCHHYFFFFFGTLYIYRMFLSVCFINQNKV